MPSPSELLRGTRLFEGLDERALGELGEGSKLRHYRRGDTIFREGDAGNCIFAVVDGLVKVFVTSPKGEDLVLATVGRAEVFGELSLIDGSDRSASAEAVDATSLLIVERMSFLDLLQRRPELVGRLLRAVGAQLRRLTDQAGDLVFLDLTGRLAKLLLHLAEQGAGAEGVDVPFNQSDLADMVGASRQTVNQGLRDLQASGFIALSGRRLSILRADALRRRAGG